MSSSNSAQELASGKLRVDEPAPGVLRIRVSNPDKRGALDHEILDALRDTVTHADARCVLITGEGSVFSAGYDLGNLSEDSLEEAAERLVAHPFVEAMDVIEHYPYPVVAAVNGHAIGGGLELAVCCDMRIAARGIKVGMPPAKIGLIYGHTGLRRFVEVCGLSNTKELFYLGRNVDAERAYAMGLFNQLVEPDELEDAALSVAAEIGANAPVSLAGNKQMLRVLRDIPGRLPEDVHQQLAALRESCFRTEDFREGVTAFREKRKPVWKGR